MRKLLFFCTLTVLFWASSAQPPAGYYDAANQLSGEALRNALHDIISNGFSSQTYDGLWSIYYQTDDKANGKVWDMYSDIPGGTPPYEYSFGSDQCGSNNSEGDCYNREHTIPASWFNDNYPMYTDVFMVVPTDGYVNNRRSNYPFGEVGSASWTSQNGSKLGSCNYSGYTGTVFEPIDSFKGDFARIYFYVAVRYKDEIPSWSAASFSGNNLSNWTENMMLEWHALDPVSDKERDRNNAVYNYQHNRNPFVDNPSWVYAIWGPEAGIEAVLPNPNLHLFPIPANDELNISFYDNFSFVYGEIFNVHGEKLLRFENRTIDISALQNGIYIGRFVFKDCIVNKTVIIQH